MLSYYQNLHKLRTVRRGCLRAGKGAALIELEGTEQCASELPNAMRSVRIYNTIWLAKG